MTAEEEPMGGKQLSTVFCKTPHQTTISALPVNWISFSHVPVT